MIIYFCLRGYRQPVLIKTYFSVGGGFVVDGDSIGGDPIEGAAAGKSIATFASPVATMPTPSTPPSFILPNLGPSGCCKLTSAVISAV
jgi:hypothetical protein